MCIRDRVVVWTEVAVVAVVELPVEVAAVAVEAVEANLVVAAESVPEPR